MLGKTILLAKLIIILIFFSGCGLFVEETKYSLEIDKIGEGEIIISGANDIILDKFKAGTTLQLKAEAESGWFFSHWENDLRGSNNPEEVTMDGNKNVKVVFLEQGLSWRYIHEGDHRVETDNGVGRKEAGKWEAAVIIEPEIEDEYITRIAFYDIDVGATVSPKIFGSDTLAEPEVSLWVGSESYTTSKAGWVEFIIPGEDKIAIDGYNYYWIILEVDDPGEEVFPLGVDYGPGKDNKNKIKGETDENWKSLTEEDSNFNFNWLINILVEYQI